MECPSCRNSVASGDRFCGSCGAPVVASCRKCGKSVKEGDAFCESCGAPVGVSEQVPAAAMSYEGGRLTFGSQPTARSPLPPEMDAPSIPQPFAAPPAFPPPGVGATSAVPSFMAPPAVYSFLFKGVWPRFFALLIDGIVISVGSRFFLPSGAGSEEMGQAILLSLLYMAYQVLFEGLVGATLGKMVLGMKVIDEAGNKPGIGRALARNILRFVDFLPALYIIGIIAIASSKRKQRVGDRVAGTFVVAR